MSETTDTRQTTVDEQELSRRQREARKDIRVIGDPVLREHAHEVTEFDRSLRKLAKRMIRTMHDAPGVGLAAPQVGVLQRLLVYDVDDDPQVLVNPVLDEYSEETEESDEGCLSVPGVTMPVERPVSVRVRGFDADRRAGRLPRGGLRGARHPARERPPGRRPHRRPHEQERTCGRAPRPARAGRRAWSGRPAAASEPHAGRLRRHSAVRRARPRGARRRGPDARGSRHQSRPSARPPRHAAGAAHQGRGRGARGAGAAARASLRPGVPGRAPRVRARRVRGLRLRPDRRSRTCSTPSRPSSCTRRWCRAGAAPLRSSGRSWPARPSSASAPCG